MELTNVLLSPVVTEKSVQGEMKRKYTFLVHQRATKTDVAHAVAKLYGVEVMSVNVIPVLKKVRVASRGRTMVKRHPARKAVVTLGLKQTLDVNKIKISK